MISATAVPLLPDAPAGCCSAEEPIPATFGPFRIFQLFVNAEGLDVRVGRTLFGLIPLGRRKSFGLYAVMLIAAPEGSKPPLLLALAADALAGEFAPLSLTPPEEWQVSQVEWRDAGAAPPMFRQPGCIDQEWGAAWYELGDEAAKQHRCRLVRTRLWRGRRAKR